jgi:hypothetical protein
MEDQTVPFYFITTFCPGFSGPNYIIRQNWDALARSKTTHSLYQTRFIAGHGRSPNHRDILVRAKLSPDGPTTIPPGVAAQTPHTKPKCNRRPCRYCNRLDRSGSIRSHVANRTYTTKTNVDGKSSNIIYCLTCTPCGLQYVGQTKRQLCAHLSEHFYDINNH